MYPVVNAVGPLSPFGRRALGQEPKPAEAAKAETAKAELAPAAATLEIDRALADAVKVSVARLLEAASEDREVALEPCWRQLRVVEWARLTALQQKLSAFLDSTSETLSIDQAEYGLMDKALACAAEVFKGEEEEVEETLGRTATLVGIAGGLAALVAAIL